MYEPHDTVQALVCSRNGDLFTGGQIRFAGSVEANNIARWDGTSWNPLGEGVDGKVCDIALDSRGNLYAGGSFTGYIAKWDGTRWKEIGIKQQRRIKALVCDKNGNLYAGGSTYDSIGKCIWKWDGKEWFVLGSGVSDRVESLAIVDSTVYVGGLFMTAGNLLSPNIAKFSIHDMPMAVVVTSRRCISEAVKYRIVELNLVFSGLAHGDCIYLYSLSVRCILKADDVSKIKLDK